MHCVVNFNSFGAVLQHVISLPGTAATKALLNESLVVMGEIGGNDYNSWLMGNQPGEKPDQYIPDVVARIGAAAQEVIDLGARAVVVPGNFPIGCVPWFLNARQSNNQSDYDEHGCLRWYNDFSQRHNAVLRQEVASLQSKNPGAKVVYADYFGAAMQFVQNPQNYGIADPLLTCCGGDGKYHTGKSCDKNATLWGSPAGFASWDSIHMTEKAYNIIADGVLNGPFADTPMRNMC
jgi:phospholipase/lecithinase/hemolysin